MPALSLGLPTLLPPLEADWRGLAGRLRITVPPEGFNGRARIKG